jgi:diguanylate cyclase (GGDEF)-like protein
MKSSVSVREILDKPPGFPAALCSRPATLVVGLALVLGIWLVDRSVSEDYRLYALYLLPIGLVAWRCGRLWAVLLSLLAVGLWTFGDPEVGQMWDRSQGTTLWNVAMRLGTFLAASLVAAKLRADFDRERDLARTDQVTGAPNRHRFVEAAEAELERARRYGRSFAVAYVDVDDFKRLNDQQGHDAGDAALRRTAEVIAAHLRVPDVFARIGGDEFAILLPETGAEAVREVADRLRQKLLEAAGQAGWPITFSIGVAGFAAPPGSAEDMLRRADELMYEAKRSGKNRIACRVFGT